MIALLAALVLAQNIPADLTLPIEKATPINDTAVSAFPLMSHWEARGRVIADDGSTIYDAQDGLLWLPAGWSTIMKEKTGVVDVVSATDHARVVVWRTVKGAFEVAASGVDGSSVKVLYRSGKDEQPGLPIADVASDAFLIPYLNSKAKTGAIRLANSAKKLEIPIRPGFIPFTFDSTRDILLGYTYSEHGGQDRLILQKIATKEDVKVPRAKGEIGVSALLPDGRILTTYKRSAADDESADNQFGIYECAPPYTELKYKGPYQIQGSSRNGKYLLISHQTQRKSWLVALK